MSKRGGLIPPVPSLPEPEPEVELDLDVLTAPTGKCGRCRLHAAAASLSTTRF